MSNTSRIQPDTTKQTPQIKGVYEALISQAGTSAPTLVVIKDTLPITGHPVWTRASEGIYAFTSAVSNYFPAGLVTYSISFNLANTNIARIVASSTEHLSVVTFTSAPALADSLLAFVPITITIWDRLQD